MDTQPEKISADLAVEMIGKLGGTTLTANALGVPVQTVDSWRKNGVPKWRASSLIAALRNVERAA